jgi:hypothetical protein
MDLYLEIITKILIAVALFLAALVWGFVKEWLKDMVVRNIVADGIRYAQKVYGHLDGDSRYDNALEKIVIRLQRWKIHLTADELKMLIESILTELQIAYGEKWWELGNKAV